MTGLNHQFWECVVKMDADRAVCKFCDLEFGKGTTITRIKFHLSGLTGPGTRICNKVPVEIKDAARAALLGNVSSRMPTGEDLGGAQETTGKATQTEDLGGILDNSDDSWEAMAPAAHLMETRGVPLPTSSTMLKGGAFVENTRKIWSWIMDDEVSTIGIYGMGLVGKTEMLKHIHNELLQSKCISHLYWVTVPQEDFSIETLQNLIAKRLDLDLSDEDDVVHRTAKLSKELTQKQKWILILDGLRAGFELDKVGIPVLLEGCKLIVSTQSEEVCKKMTSQNIKVDILSDEEALELFMKKFGPNIELSLEKNRLAKCVVEECRGLPATIVAMAGCMKLMRYDHQWRIALQELKQSRAGKSDMENPGAGASSSGGLTCNTNETPGDPLPTSLHVEVDNVAPQGQHLEDDIENDIGQRKKWTGMVIQNDPEKVQDAARAAIDGPPEKKQKVIAGSSNNEVNNAIPTSAQKQNYEGRHVEMAQQGEAFSPTALKVCLDSIVDKEIELSINQADGPRGDSSSPKDLSCLGLGSYHDQLCSPSAKNDVIMDDVQNVVREKTEPVASMSEQSNAILLKLAGDDGRIQVGVQAMEQGAEEELICSHPEAESGMEYSFEGFIQHDRNVSPKRARLMENSSGRLVQPSTSASSTKLVGQAFEQNMKVIRSWLMDDEVSTIGIYGMGGVGKTTMLQHICNELLGRPGISQDVCWVTISQDFNIKKLQNLIAKCLDLDISSEDDDSSKTVKLAKELAKKQKWILIIDDLWNSFKPQEVGIPIPLKGSKLIMTTRSEMVCRQMNSQKNIRVDPLSDEESWTLFMDKLGQDKPLSPEVEQIAVDVARECAGLPLGIVTLAKSLKGVDDLFEWRITLKRLKESNFWDMEDQIFQILRLSYDCLDDSAQQCFAYCALFDERHKIKREELIGLFIEEGIIKEMDNGHSILDRLEDVCLLERIDGGSAVKMHDLLRDMAMHILDEYSLIMR